MCQRWDRFSSWAPGARAALGLLVGAGAIWAQAPNARGRVMMENGAPPPKSVLIQRYCGASRVMVEASTNRNGEYVLRASEFESVGNWGSRQMGTFGTMKCALRASLSGWESSMIDLDDPTLVGKRELPPLILRKRGSSSLGVDVKIHAPRVSERAFERGLKALAEKHLDEAEKQFLLAVKAAPDFSQAWNALGTTYLNAKKIAEARDAFEHAAKADPKTLTSQVLLMRLESSQRNWAESAKAAAAVIEKDSNHKFPEAFLHQALARFHQQDFAGAEQSVAEAVKWDPNHQLQNTEYIYGLILESRRDYARAEEHYRKYLKDEPKAANADAVRTRIANLGKGGASMPGLPELESVDLNVRAVRSIGTPGGMKALSRIAHIDPQPAPAAFFEEYCRALIRSTDPSSGSRHPRYIETLRLYFASMLELTSAGAMRDHGTTVSISLAHEGDRPQAVRVLQALGWRLRQTPGAAPVVELSDGPEDGPRQMVAEALGIDEIEMKETLEAGRTFGFEIPTEEAPLMGGDAWVQLVHDRQMLPGGLPEAFARDLRLARAYAGLSTLSTETAEAVVAGLGLRTLVEQHAHVLMRAAGTFAVKNGTVEVPGGAAAIPAWTALAGAGPADPVKFFSAILSKDHGKPADFFAAVARTGAAHQAFFTHSAPRLEKFYAAFADPAERPAQAKPREPSGAQWTAAELRQLPLAADGTVRYPGGKALWGRDTAPDEEILTASGVPARLLALARIFEQRGSEFSSAAAALWKEHYDRWRPLAPYFGRFRALDHAELEALKNFGDQLPSMPPAMANDAMGLWYSVVELAATGADLGTLSQATAAGIFKRACDTLGRGDRVTAAIRLVRDLGGSDPDDEIPARLLKLDGARRDAYHQVLKLQEVPALAAAVEARNESTLLHALSGILYAARLDPESLLVSEDHHLLARHSFATESRDLPSFRTAALERSNQEPGSRLTGGFLGLKDIARRLARGGETGAAAGELEAPAEVDSTGRGAAEVPLAPAGQIFRADVRLVEVYTTVTDANGRYVDDLPQGDFVLEEDGKPRPIAAFESRQAALNCVLLLDTTFSMQAAMPVLKNAAFELIDQLRPIDTVSVYTFSDLVLPVQPSTPDRRAAKRAIAHARPRGETALYDSLTRVIRDTARQSGKKVIVVFTDGDDNFSSLSAEDVVRRAKAAGIPVYTIAQGMALNNSALLRELAAISQSTGGLPFAIRDPREIQQVFDTVAKDLAHGYLLTFSPTPGEDGRWRQLAVQLKTARGYKVRAREGYFPE